jgi:hypothetical protein
MKRIYLFILNLIYTKIYFKLKIFLDFEFSLKEKNISKNQSKEKHSLF